MLGFSQFKRAYEEVTEGRAQTNQGKISKPEFLEMIEGPFHKAFTPENVRKSFEVTGTWPVDCSKITTDKLAPSRGLSITGGPVITPTSPVKVWVNRMEQLGQLALEPVPALEIAIDLDPNLPLPPSPTTSVPSGIEDDNEDEDILAELCQTRAAFLFDRTGSTAKMAIPALNLPPLPEFTPSLALLEHSMPSATSKQMKSQLVDAFAATTCDNRKLVAFADRLQHDNVSL